ncbi:SDR family oxidoreductase [Leptospira sp. 201903070]|uniref:SDR family oxidoreductase n=1 Tax=Leptospira ainlahdjerensis TaxID=2810033 RepID=A0ABS2UCM6_9LEPT|nr:SDR family oxidoreductase [Leptospira ainlahdjerensis]MBM9577313.1 SDR family oxidoreductase [Leptospira ainlahdjerensis]
MDSLFSLKDKVVVITGAGGLLGRKHAEAVASRGGIPVLLDVNLSSVTSLSKDISERFGIESNGFQVDITKENEVEKNCSEVLKIYGKIDALVNNAANNPKIEESSTKNFSRLENFSTEVWMSDLAVGLTGAYLCSKYYGFAISKNQNGGSILNISSDLGLIAPDQRLYRKKGVPDDLQPVKPVTYSVVKAGIIGLTRYLATYWADKNVRCNAICPGGVENQQNPEFLKEIATRIPLGRMAQADEYQGLVIFLLSDSSSYINGSIIAADGGRTVW